MIHDPAHFAEAAQTFREDLITAAGLELASYVEHVSQRPQSDFIEKLSDWGFDPLEWSMMPKEERLHLIAAKTNARREQLSQIPH